LNTETIRAWRSDAPPRPIRTLPVKEPLPSEWTVAHVKRRLLEALGVDYRQMGIGRPRLPGGTHPEIVRTAAEIAEAEVFELDPRRFRPTRAETARADTVLAWLTLVTSAGDRLALRNSLRAESAGKPTKRCDAESQAIERALATIAFNLNGRREAVF
jgi:hypothetical protein